jgi:hypothetical protein
MFKEITRLVISREASAPIISLERIHINPAMVVTITAYDNIKSFLEQQGSELSSKSYSIVKLATPAGAQEIITLGAPSDIAKDMNTTPQTTRPMRERGLLVE